jgi:hypothetical protein
MSNMSNLLKTAALAGLIGVGASGVTLASASADTVETRCDGYGACYQVRCDDYGAACYRLGYLGSGYLGSGYGATRRWVCDSDGYDCHWVYYDDNGDYRYHLYAPGVDFSHR